ncbi:hypothetical protein BU16DRAFT_532421 [Lophium mytilinum]|uniref:Zn(2)-C6 fungal-type domain-containing protein n=1 Tax=Lophium mytilinum TaxID=390894 RepID=A0A6A6RE39_9PEZI|nr:hypothetical protein BU16DRAFT_532421 [Lophium mytilinum]
MPGTNLHTLGLRAAIWARFKGKIHRISTKDQDHPPGKGNDGGRGHCRYDGDGGGRGAAGGAADEQGAGGDVLIWGWERREGGRAQGALRTSRRMSKGLAAKGGALVITAALEAPALHPLPTPSTRDTTHIEVALRAALARPVDSIPQASAKPLRHRVVFALPVHAATSFNTGELTLVTSSKYQFAMPPKRKRGLGDDIPEKDATDKMENHESAEASDTSGSPLTDYESDVASGTVSAQSVNNNAQDGHATVVSRSTSAGNQLGTPATLRCLSCRHKKARCVQTGEERCDNCNKWDNECDLTKVRKEPIYVCGCGAVLTVSHESSNNKSSHKDCAPPLYHPGIRVGHYTCRCGKERAADRTRPPVEHKECLPHLTMTMSPAKFFARYYGDLVSQVSSQSTPVPSEREGDDDVMESLPVAHENAVDYTTRQNRSPYDSSPDFSQYGSDVSLGGLPGPSQQRKNMTPLRQTADGLKQTADGSWEAQRPSEGGGSRTLGPEPRGALTYLSGESVDQTAYTDDSTNTGKGTPLTEAQTSTNAPPCSTPLPSAIASNSTPLGQYDLRASALRYIWHLRGMSGAPPYHTNAGATIAPSYFVLPNTNTNDASRPWAPGPTGDGNSSLINGARGDEIEAAGDDLTVDVDRPRALQSRAHVRGNAQLRSEGGQMGISGDGHGILSTSAGIASQAMPQTDSVEDRGIASTANTTPPLLDDSTHQLHSFKSHGHAEQAQRAAETALVLQWYKKP